MSEATLEELGGWPVVLRRLVAGEDLPADHARAAMAEILEGGATPAQIAGFLIGLRLKGESVEEMAGFLAAMVAAARTIDLGDADPVDTCGTGGSAQRRAGAFNVSTISSFVVAGAGGRVCKHGGRAASATSSSAELLEQLGVAFDLDGDGVARCVRTVGMGFCFAPNFHPAMRHAAPTRRELGVPTIFNFIAPLANPARVQRQVLGVSDPRMAEKMVGVLRARGAERVLVVYGHDGLDELTTTTTSTVIDVHGEDSRTYVVDPAALGLPLAAPDELKGGDAATNAELARRILDGERGSHRDLVVLNAAAGLLAAGVAEDLPDGVERASASLDEGQARQVLEGLVATSQAARAAQADAAPA